MKDIEQTILRIPGVTEVQVFAKVLVRCELPMADDTITGLQTVQERIEHETGWKVEMTISAGKRPEPMPATNNEARFVGFAEGSEGNRARANYERNLQGWAR